MRKPCRRSAGFHLLPYQGGGLARKRTVGTGLLSRVTMGRCIERYWVFRASYLPPGLSVNPAHTSCVMLSTAQRSLRSENNATNIVALHCSKDCTNLIDNIGRVYRKVFLSNPPPGELDFEYMEHEGILHVPRVYENDEVETLSLSTAVSPHRNYSLSGSRVGL